MNEMNSLTIGGKRYDSFACRTAANALTDTLIGAAVSTDIVSPIEHDVLCRVSGAADLTQVKVICCGANLLDAEGAISASVGTSISDGYLLYKTGALGSGGLKIPIHLPKGVGVTFIAHVENMVNAVNGISFIAEYSDGTTTTSSSLFFSKLGETGTIKFVTNESKELVSIRSFHSNSQPAKMILSKSAIVLGHYSGSAIESEPYRGSVFTPSEDGTVSGMKSVSPNMIILTDTEGVTIKAAYNMDANKVIAKLSDRIAALEKHHSEV